MSKYVQINYNMSNQSYGENHMGCGNPMGDGNSMRYGNPIRRGNNFSFFYKVFKLF